MLDLSQCAYNVVVLALRKDGGLNELNRFECPGPSALFASADVAIL